MTGLGCQAWLSLSRKPPLAPVEAFAWWGAAGASAWEPCCVEPPPPGKALSRQHFSNCSLAPAGVSSLPSGLEAKVPRQPPPFPCPVGGGISSPRCKAATQHSLPSHGRPKPRAGGVIPAGLPPPRGRGGLRLARGTLKRPFPRQAGTTEPSEGEHSVVGAGLCGALRLLQCPRCSFATPVWVLPPPELLLFLGRMAQEAPCGTLHTTGLPQFPRLRMWAGGSTAGGGTGHGWAGSTHGGPSGQCSVGVGRVL